MKVIKCLEHIPKELWGKVVEDNFLGIMSRDGCGIHYDLIPTDTFPLPEQGDKVEVSDDGSFKDYNHKDKLIIFLCSLNFKYFGLDGHLCFCGEWEDDGIEKYRYIRPIEKEEYKMSLETAVRKLKEMGAEIENITEIINKTNKS